jgi:4-carboxymuconolactone decarboxylase
VSAREAGWSVKLVFFFTRRSIARLAGRQPERMIEPLELYAQLPGLLRGYGRLEQATAKLHGLETRIKALVQLKAATLTHCEFCIDLGSQIARRWGLTPMTSCWRCPPLGRALSSLRSRSSCSITPSE